MTTVKFWDITLNNVEVGTTIVKKRIINNKLNVGFVNITDLGKASEILRLKCNFDSTSDYTNIIKVIKKISEEPYTTMHWIEFDSGGTYEDKSGWYALTSFQEGVKAGTSALNEFDLELIKYGHNCKIWGKWSDWTVSGPTSATDETNNQRAYNNESVELDDAGEYVMVDGGTSLIERNGYYKAFARVRCDVTTSSTDYITFELIDNTASQDVSKNFYTEGNTTDYNTKIGKDWTMIFLDCPDLLASSDMDLKITLTQGTDTDFFIDYFGMYSYRYTHGA